MKTKLPVKIETIEQAKLFLINLIQNDEIFHPEDDAHDIIWELPEAQLPTKEECERLNSLMEDMYFLEGNNGNHANPIFDPCEFILTTIKAD